MKILVTGAEGQLARSLVERAAARSHMRLVALGRPRLDLAREGSATSAIEALRPDIVVNAAAHTAVDTAEDEPQLAFRINAEAAGEVAAAAAGVGARVVQVSTDYVFDGRNKDPYREGDPTHPLGVYGASKLAGEERVRGANPRHTIVRTAWLYSPFGRNFVRTIMDAALVRDVLTVVDDQLGSPTSALDLAEGLLAMTDGWKDSPEVGTGETYHLAGRGVASWCALADHVMGECRARGLASAEVRPIGTADWPTRAARPANSVLDSGKFASDFGFIMPDWRSSVSSVVARIGPDPASDSCSGSAAASGTA
jgi:dTDP-4-dehydrorhamnose reductase